MVFINKNAKGNRMANKRVVIHVKGGIANVESLPEGVEVHIIDFDDDSIDEPELHKLVKLEEGEIVDVQYNGVPVPPVDSGASGKPRFRVVIGRSRITLSRKPATSKSNWVKTDDDNQASVLMFDRDPSMGNMDELWTDIVNSAVESL
jgi:hypothetical protein